jgi:hypothetical protein
LSYFVYDSHHKIFQLYRQLPEARFVMQKRSATSNCHNDSDLHFPQRKAEELDPFLSHIGSNASASRYHETMLDKNEMYQRRQVLQQLRQSGQLRRALPGMPFCPGMFYELEGAFRAAEGEGQAAARTPKGAVWLNCPAGPKNPAACLLCNKAHFASELGENAWQEFFCLDSPLPLRGVVLCLQRAEYVLVGLPLFLAI